MKSWSAVALTLLCISVLIPARTAIASGLSESLKDKLVCPAGSTCEVVRTGKFKISGTLFDDGNFDSGGLNESSPVILSIGNLTYNGTLGDDPNYEVGDTSFTYVKSHVDAVTGKTVVDLKISLKGSSSGVKLAVSGTSSDMQVPILADDYLGVIGDIMDTTTASFQIGSNVEAISDIAVTGKSSVKTVIKDGQTNDLHSVKVKAR